MVIVSEQAVGRKKRAQKLVSDLRQYYRLVDCDIVAIPYRKYTSRLDCRRRSYISSCLTFKLAQPYQPRKQHNVSKWGLAVANVDWRSHRNKVKVCSLCADARLARPSIRKKMFYFYSTISRVVVIIAAREAEKIQYICTCFLCVLFFFFLFSFL